MEKANIVWKLIVKAMQFTLVALAIGWAHYSQAAIPRRAESYLVGSFVMPNSKIEMALWIGKLHSSDRQISAVLESIKRVRMEEAQCRLVHFERFEKNYSPALMQLECQGARIPTLRMPLTVQWTNPSQAPTIRLGSSIYGVEEASLHLTQNHYAKMLGQSLAKY